MESELTPTPKIRTCSCGTEHAPGTMCPSCFMPHRGFAGRVITPRPKDDTMPASTNPTPPDRNLFTNDELRQAISDTIKMQEKAGWEDEKLQAHFDALLAEQLRRARGNSDAK